MTNGRMLSAMPLIRGEITEAADFKIKATISSVLKSGYSLISICQYSPISIFFTITPAKS